MLSSRAASETFCRQRAMASCISASSTASRPVPLKGRSFAIGPSIKYSGEGGWFVTAKWSKETEVRNRAPTSQLLQVQRRL